MDNMDIYNNLRKPPESACKPIAAGRLKGKTDINPMWRIKALTEQFGPCGIGWKYVIKDKTIIPGANNEQSAFVDIDLYYEWDGVWSEPVPGTGGASFVASERNGLYTSDECFKMALTDAISVAAKALGVGADVYWAEDATKYNGGRNNDGDENDTGEIFPHVTVLCERCKKQIQGVSRNGQQIRTKSEIIKRSHDKYNGHNYCYFCMLTMENEKSNQSEAN